MIVLDAILLILSTILSTGFALVVRPRRRELVCWAVAYACLLVGVSLFGLRSLIPDFISIVIGNTLIFLFFADIVIGIDFFRGRKPRIKAAMSGVAVAFGYFFWFGIVAPNLTFRFVFYSLFIATASIMGAVAIARGADKSIAIVSRMTGGTLVCIALVNLSRLYFGSSGLPADIMDAAAWEGAVQAVSGTLVMILCFALLLLHERRESERLALAARDRELLVREMAHRTKNDLALVDSLISIERESLASGRGSGGGDRVSARLDALRDRIRCLADAHDRLSRSDEPGVIKLDEYLDVVASALPAKPGVVVERDFAPVATSFGLAAPLGLAMNELATNALKHAFPEARGGTVRLSLRATSGKDGGLEAVLEVRDDGKGVSWPPESPGLGAMIVDSFAHKLGGKLEYSFEGGSVFRLSFAIPPEQLRGAGSAARSASRATRSSL